MCMSCGEGQNGFPCYDPVTRRMRVSRNVIYLKNVFFYEQSSSTNANQPADSNNCSISLDLSPLQLDFF